MAKNRHSKPEEFHKGRIRELMKEIISLKRRIKQLERSEWNYNNKESREEIEKLERTKLVLCDSCKEGIIESIIVAGRIFNRCNSCGKRSPAKKI